MNRELEKYMMQTIAAIPVPRHSNCTTTAKRLIYTLAQGETFGYYCEENPEAKVGEAESGHDFAVIDDFLVDPWAIAYCSEEFPEFNGVIDLRNIDDDPVESLKLKHMYGDRKKWIIVESNNSAYTGSEEEISTYMHIISQIATYFELLATN